ncbi:MAG: glycosyltransferase [Anaerolineales bacterium]
MNIFYIVPYVPNLIRVRPFNFIRELSARGHHVKVFTVWKDEEEYGNVQKLNNICEEVNAVRVTPQRSLLNVAYAFPTSQPLQYVYSWSDELANKIQEDLSWVDVVHVEHLRGARYGISVRDGRAESLPPIVWDSVDSISYLFKQASNVSRTRFGSLITRFDLKRTRCYEAELVHRFDRVIVTSKVDREELIRLAKDADGHRLGGELGLGVSHLERNTLDQEHIHVLPNGVDLDYFTPADNLRDPDMLVFSGKMSYHANATAALFLVEQLMPRIWCERPQVQLSIVGKDPPKQIRILQEIDPRVIVTGTVPDIRPYLQNASVALLPIVYGAGCQNKVLEAMACGTPVVTMPQAISALKVQEGEEIFVGREPDELAHLVLDLLGDPNLRSRIGEAGRLFVEKNHRWTDITAKLEEIYCEVRDVKH